MHVKCYFLCIEFLVLLLILPFEAPIFKTIQKDSKT